MSELIKTFERLKVAKHFGDPAVREDYFRSVDYATWMGELDDMNAAMRGLHEHSADRGPRNNSLCVEVPGAHQDNGIGNVLYIPPHHDDIDELQKRAFSTAQALPDIEDAADLLYISGNLTQRYWNGNLSTSGLARALLTVGYSNVGFMNRQWYNRLYNTIAKKRKGVQKAGLEMDLTHLQHSYAVAEIGHIRQHYDYDNLIPRGVAPFKVSTLRRIQPDMAPHNVTHAAHLFAEPFMNVPLITSFMLSAGMRVMHYLRDSPDGTGYLVNVPRLMRDIPLQKFDQLYAQDNLRKKVFLNSIIEAFRGHNFIYGDNHKEMLAQLQPASSPSR